MDNLDPRIGYLNSGRFYAFVDGYDRPEFSGTRAEVEAALGLRSPTPAAPAAAPAAAAPARAARPQVLYRAELTCPNGHREIYSALARSKGVARACIAQTYREENPRAAGCYTFAQCAFLWIEEEREEG